MHCHIITVTPRVTNSPTGQTCGFLDCSMNTKMKTKIWTTYLLTLQTPTHWPLPVPVKSKMLFSLIFNLLRVWKYLLDERPNVLKYLQTSPVWFVVDICNLIHPGCQCPKVISNLDESESPQTHYFKTAKWILINRSVHKHFMCVFSGLPGHQLWKQQNTHCNLKLFLNTSEPVNTNPNPESSTTPKPIIQL